MSPNKASPQRHVAAMAFPFGCHALPLLNLTQKLAIALPDTHFSFLNTAKSNNFLALTSNIDLPSNIKVYDVDDGVPTNHVLSRNPAEAVELFVKATPDNFKKALKVAVTATNQSICCLITDGFLTFAATMAEEMGVPWMPLWVPVPYALSVHVYSDMIHQIYSHENDTDNNDKRLEKIPGLSQIHVADLPEGILSSGRSSDESPFACMLSKLGYVLDQSKIIVMNYCEEFYSPPLLSDLKSKFPKLINVGFLTLAVSPPIRPPPQSPSNIDATGCLLWLDAQKAISVAYISFGTVAALPPNEILELAEALEATGVPFLWSLKDNMKHYLPNQFLARTSMQGIVVPWAPQTQVLAHSSIGVFVTHFGSNSVNESIANGVPMIGRPFFGDHKINGRMVEEIQGIGVRVERDIITKDRLIMSLELVLVFEQGKEMRTKLQALREIALKAAEPNGSATHDFKSLVEKILIL